MKHYINYAVNFQIKEKHLWLTQGLKNVTIETGEYFQSAIFP